MDLKEASFPVAFNSVTTFVLCAFKVALLAIYGILAYLCNWPEHYRD